MNAGSKSCKQYNNKSAKWNKNTMLKTLPVRRRKTEFWLFVRPHNWLSGFDFLLGSLDNQHVAEWVPPPRPSRLDILFWTTLHLHDSLRLWLSVPLNSFPIFRVITFRYSPACRWGSWTRYKFVALRYQPVQVAYLASTIVISSSSSTTTTAASSICACIA